MKKIMPIVLVGILVLSGFGAIATNKYTTDEAAADLVDLETLVMPISFPNSKEYQIIDSEMGHKIEIEGYGYLMNPGKPLLPSRNLLIALPPGAEVESVKVKGENAKQLPGTYQIIPTPQMVPMVDLEEYSDYAKSIHEGWQEKNELIYSSDDAYPGEIGKLVGSGTLRKYSYVSVSVCPFRYHPLSGRLIHYDTAQIIINYDLPSFDRSNFQKVEESKWDTLADERASKLFVNYDEVKNLYQPSGLQARPLLQTHDYVIITTSDLSSAITSSSFLAWKTSLGYNTEIVHITDTGISSQSGRDLAEQIRNFLREHYMSWGIKYALLVGDYETIPMRYCYPDPTNHRYEPFDYTSGEVPTDYYYADLSSSDSESWDADGDGFYGEYGQDYPDFLTEISVGRIPTNDISRITYTLDKLVTFEQDTRDWKNNALHAGAFFYFTNEDRSGWTAMDGAVLSHYIEEDIMDGWTISHYSEQEGLEKSVYDWPALSETAFIDDWRNGQYAVVNWQGHGWTNGVARKVWSWDDGDDVPEGNEMSWPYFITTDSNLDDDYPSIVTAVSCYVGCPEPNGESNLGIDLLTNPSFGASIGVVASARSPYGSIDWNPSSPGGSDSIIYEFNKNMISNHEKIGDALYNSKFFCNSNYGWDEFYEYIDMYTFNLFGDPSLTLEGINVEGGPDKPNTPSGPASGKAGDEYTYSSSTIDPDEDQIYYWFDWGDGENSGWLGPFDSGVDASASHIWDEKGNYEIKVKAKDIFGVESEWSYPLAISMPRNKAINPLSSQLLELFIERFPLLFLFLQFQSFHKLIYNIGVKNEEINDKVK